MLDYEELLAKTSQMIRSDPMMKKIFESEAKEREKRAWRQILPKGTSIKKMRRLFPVRELPPVIQIKPVEPAPKVVYTLLETPAYLSQPLPEIPPLKPKRVHRKKEKVKIICQCVTLVQHYLDCPKNFLPFFGGIKTSEG